MFDILKSIMTFSTHPLPPSLSPFIHSIFHFKDFVPDHHIERVVPTGHVFLIFELDGMPRHTFDNATLKPNATFTKAWISGMHRKYISISAHPKSEMLVVQFRATGAYPFLHVPMQTINEEIFPAEKLLGEEVLALRSALMDVDIVEKKLLVAEEWLLRRFDANKTPPTDLLTLINHLQTGPTVGYQEALNNYPNSQKHLIHQFKKYVGLTPKYYQRILRFNEILQKIQQKEEIAWAQVAYQCGFTDQSHFIKEFKHFSGFNPESFTQQAFHQQEPNFFPLDREG